MPRLINSPDQLYRKHQKLIYKLINQYADQGTAEYADLESLSNEVFARCFRRWAPGKGAFSTLLYTALSNAFRSERKKANNRARNEGLFAHSAIEEVEPLPSSRDWLTGFLQAIDSDARQIVARLLQFEGQTSEEITDRNATKRVLRDELTGAQGWTRHRVKKAFREVREALAR